MAPGGAIKWYVLCGTAHKARVVRDELSAFVGRSYASFDGRSAELRDDDDIERALKAEFPGRVYVLATPDPSLEDGLREKLRLLLRLWDERPARLATMCRATGRILRDFEYALARADGDAAAGFISELRTSGRLGAFNALFLEVRRLGSLGLWKDILSMPEVGSLLATQRPRRVTETLIHAVYETQLRRFESEGGPAKAIAHCTAEVLPRYGVLFKSQVGLSGYVVDVSFLLAALASTPPNLERVRSIVSSYGEGRENPAYITAIVGQLEVVESPPPTDALVDAKNALASADFDRAFSMARELPESFEKVAILLQCAREMGALESAKIALTAVDALHETEWERFCAHASLVRIYEGLAALAPATDRGLQERGTSPEAIPSSWEDWLDRLTHPSPWPSAVTVAEVGSREWSLQNLMAVPESVARLASGLLGTRPAWGEEAIHDSLPYLIGFFLKQGPDGRSRAIYDSLFLVAASDDQASIPQLSALCDLAEVRIALGIKAADYRDTLHALGVAIERTGSARVANSALDLLDGLATLPCADEAARQSLVVRVQGVFVRWHRRIAPEQWALLYEVAGELGVSVEVPEVRQDTVAESSQDKWNALAEKRVALYSLREPALRRAQAVLKQLCPSVTVQLFSDHVGGSPSLRAASATADVFVIAIAAAKHAATGFIEASRPATRVTLRARSQGSASLLEALASYVDHAAIE
jgi:hypothetical protein